MSDLRQLETLLHDAVAQLVDSGFPLAAEALSERLRGICDAPTAGARRHRMDLLCELFDGIGSASVAFRLQPMDERCAPSAGMYGFRFTRTEAHRLAEQRYHRTLSAIRDALRSSRVA
jgi:hypothetical protein